MLRSLIILALLATLVYLVKHLQPVAEPGGAGKTATSRPEVSPVEVVSDDGAGRFNPPVVTPLPDVNKGYVFSEKREFVKEAPPEPGKSARVEQGPDPLESLLYSGSVIVGNLRRALVSYQEQSRETTRRPSPGRGPTPAAAQGAVRNKQLHQGDSFLGYVVAAIEPDRIVFAKGELKVEKFLYDRNKKRLAVSESGRRETPPAAEVGGVPLQALAPPERIEALMASPSMRSAPGTVPSGLPPGAGLGGLNSEATPTEEAGGVNGRAQTPAPVNRAIRRSQRLLGIDPLGTVPLTPVPGRPVPNN